MVVPREQTVADDPPLTYRGIDQSLLTGKFLKQYFEDTNMTFTKIIIKSSPFLRCIMTASGIAQDLFEDTQNVQIKIDSHLAELLDDKMYKENPIPKLEILQCKTPA